MEQAIENMSKSFDESKYEPITQADTLLELNSIFMKGLVSNIVTIFHYLTVAIELDYFET